MEENVGNIPKVSSSKLKIYLLGILFTGLVLYLFFSLETCKSSIELLRVQNLLDYGMTETQANYLWDSTPIVLNRNDKTMLPDIPINLIPQGGKLVRYSKILPSCYYLVHFNEEHKIDFLYFWQS
ncbi:hypothetical protein LLG46_08765 [bacterium]|nr:hypothetical protein [bacterium]